MMRQRMGWASFWSVRLLAIGASLLLAPALLMAAHPQAPIGTGLNTGGDGFSEQFGFGFGLGSPSGTGFFSIFGTQSSNRSVGGQMGSVTVGDGGTGFISDSSLVPFVTSVVPVVGGSSVLGERLERIKGGDTGGPRRGATSPAPPAASGGNDPTRVDQAAALRVVGAHAVDPAVALGRNLAAASGSVGQGMASVAEIRAQQAAEEETAAAEFRQILDQAQRALEAGKPNVARIYYQQVMRRANGPLKQQALAGLKALDFAPNSAARKGATPPTAVPTDDGPSP